MYFGDSCRFFFSNSEVTGIQRVYVTPRSAELLRHSEIRQTTNHIKTVLLTYRCVVDDQDIISTTNSITMKLATASLLLISALSASATSIRSGNAARSLLSVARKLEDNAEEEEQQEQEYSFLTQYSLKLLGCSAAEKYKNPENGEYESSSVVFRLCPAAECDSEVSYGCKSGYGDYVVGINTFTQAWLEDKREDMQQDDAFNIEEYGECREYEVDQDNDDENNNGNQQAQYYVGPACGDDGASIKLGFFSDYLCSYEPEDVTFEDISNGWSLPYSSGLVTNACEDCAGYNDNGEYEIGEMCMQLYEWSGKCESDMEYTSQYGANTASCEQIESLMPKSKSGGNVGKAFGWILFVLVLGGIGFYGYSVWWRKRKSGAAADGLMN